MGQYYKVVNCTKKEFINAWTFNDGAKLMEFGLSAFGMMSGLAILLTNGNGRGGGDIEDPLIGIVGRWAGDRIVIAGDYGDEGKFITAKDIEGMINDKTDKPVAKNEVNLYTVASEKYKNISLDVLFALMADNFAREEIVKHKKNKEVEDFNKIHEQLAKDKDDLPLLIGCLKTEAGKSILERFLKGKQ
jgi:hypothetical protein